MPLHIYTSETGCWLQPHITEQVCLGSKEYCWPLRPKYERCNTTLEGAEEDPSKVWQYDVFGVPTAKSKFTKEEFEASEKDNPVPSSTSGEEHTEIPSAEPDVDRRVKNEPMESPSVTPDAGERESEVKSERTPQAVIDGDPTDTFSRVTDHRGRSILVDAEGKAVRSSSRPDLVDPTVWRRSNPSEKKEWTEWAQRMEDAKNKAKAAIAKVPEYDSDDDWGHDQCERHEKDFLDQ